MNKKKYIKGEYGYFHNYRKSNIVFITCVVLFAVVTFCAGLLAWRTKSNILTVVAVLSMLPACKRIVNLIVIYPYKDINELEYKKLSAYQNDIYTFYVDAAFSTDKSVYKFDYVVINNSGIFAYSTMKQMKNIDCEEYIVRGLKARNINSNFKIYSNLNDFEHLLKVMNIDEEFTNEAAVEFFRTLML